MIYPNDETVEALNQQSQAAFAAGDGELMLALHKQARKYLHGLDPTKTVILGKRGKLISADIPATREEFNDIVNGSD